MLVRRKSACKTSLRAAAKFSDGWPHFWVQIWIPKRGPSKDPKEGMKMWSNSGPHPRYCTAWHRSRLFRVKSTPGCYSNWWQKIDLFPWRLMIRTIPILIRRSQNRTQQTSLRMKGQLSVMILCINEAQDDTPYFQTGAEPPPREEWKVADPINFRDINGVLCLSHQLDAIFRSAKEIETPLGMDTTQQLWRWADVGSCQMPRSPPRYPTLMIDDGGVRQPAASQVHHKTLFRWIVGNLSWLAQYDKVYYLCG